MGFKDGFSHFKASLKPDKRFGKILLWEILLVAVVALGILVWASQMNKLEPLIEQATAPLMGAKTMFETAIMSQGAESAAQELKSKTIWYTSLLVIYIILVWPFFKSLTYLALFRKKLDKRFYFRFMLAWVCWTALLFGVYYVLQLIFYNTIFNTLDTSALSRVTLLLGIIIAFILSCYFTITFFISFTKEKTVKEALKLFLGLPVKKIGRFILPMVFVLLVFLVLNIITRIVNFLPQQVSTVISAFIMISFIVWMKVYYSSCMERSQKPVPHEVHRKKK
jgi:hypothetical protein